MTRVLLCTAHFGEGHRQVASALRDAFEQRGAVVEEVDCLRSSSSLASGASEFTFEWLTRHAPWFYGISYDWTRRLPSHHAFWSLLSAGARRAAAREVERFRPDVVLQLYPEQTLRQAHAWPGHPVTGVVLTDYSVHARWFCPGADVYYLPHETLESEAERMLPRVRSSRNVANPKRMPEIKSLGIPLRPQFAREESGVERNRLVVATGGRGVFGEFHETLSRLAGRFPEYPIDVLCGRNQDMMDHVRQWQSECPNLQPVPFVQDVARYLRRAKFAVVKPGGVTVSECLATGCPMIFVGPAYGQERGNAAWIDAVGAGFWATSFDQLDPLLGRLRDESLLAVASRVAFELGRPDAASQVAEDALQRALQRSAAR